MPNIALILASGTGSRTNQDVPKQFLCVNDKPIIIYTLEAFENHEEIDKIVVVALDGWKNFISVYAKQFKITKLDAIINGESTRGKSMYNGLVYLKENFPLDTIAVIHDANRPLVSSQIIADSIKVCDNFDFALSAVPCFDTMFTSEDLKSVDNVYNRDKIFKGHTPESVKTQKFFKVLSDEAFEENNISVFLKNKCQKVHFSLGSDRNFKITTKEDIEMFKAVVESKKLKNLK